MNRFAFLAALAVFTLAGCTNKKASGDNAGTDGDFVSGTPLADREEGVSFLGSNVDRDKFAPVYFAFDSHDVGAGERGKIEQVAAFQRENGGTIVIAGFTDERGTPEYNRGLGERRALAVREAVSRAGGDARKLQTVSFGAEMPASEGSSEGAYAKNRRAEFGVVR